jgi:hypothetical protein
MKDESIETARAMLEYWSQYPLPILDEESTESERLWHSFLYQKRLDLKLLSA